MKQARYDRPRWKDATHERSPLAEALAAVGDRWTLLVVEALLDGPLRFNELQERIEGIAPNILTQRLRRLEQEGLVVAQPYSERPPRYVYELTGGRPRAGRRAAAAGRLGRAPLRGRAGRATPPAAPRSRRAGTAPPASETVDEPGEEGVHYA